MPIDLEVGGVYLPPIAQALLLALPIFLLLDWTLRRLGVLRFRLARGLVRRRVVRLRVRDADSADGSLMQ